MRMRIRRRRRQQGEAAKAICKGLIIRCWAKRRESNEGNEFHKSVGGCKV